MLTKFILIKLAHSIALVSRPDVRGYINGNLNAALNMSNKIDDLLAKKGISVKPPYTPVPNMVDFIESTDYFGSLFGKKRAINVLEATHIFDRLATKFSERAFVTAFAQVAQDKKVKQYFNKVIHVLDKEVDRWSALLNEENIRLPMSWRSDITDSTEPPFSDKLMLFQIVLDISFSVTANGFSLANCNRLDIVGIFEKTFLDLQLLGKDGLDLMIESKWMEEIPSVVDRQELIGLKH